MAGGGDPGARGGRYCLKVGLLYERHYRQRSATLFAEAARQMMAAGGPSEMAENALVSAIDVSAGLGDLALCGELYAAAAELPLPPKRKDRYAALATRFRAKGERSAPGPSFPDYLRRTDAYQDVWRQDIIEWELDGRPVPVLAYIVVERVDHAPFARAALRALLHCVDEKVALDEPGAASDLAHALGAVQVYEVLRPLEHLGGHREARVRAAVMSAVSQVYCKRSFGLVRLGLQDSDDMVRQAALRALRALHFRDGLEPLSRIFRESDDETSAWPRWTPSPTSATWKPGTSSWTWSGGNAGRCATGRCCACAASPWRNWPPPSATWPPSRPARSGGPWRSCPAAASPAPV